MILRLARLVIQPGSVQMHPDDLFANLFENAVTRKKRNELPPKIRLPMVT